MSEPDPAPAPSPPASSPPAPSPPAPSPPAPSPPAPLQGSVAHRETLWVPWHWWLVSAGLVVSVLLAFLSFLGWQVAVVAALLVSLTLAGALLGYGGIRIEVGDSGLQVGRRLLEWEWLGEARPLTERQTQRRTGPDADARALLVLRPYLSTAVEITVDDAADPHPYWLIGTRRPQRLAAAITAGAARHGRSTTAPGEAR